MFQVSQLADLHVPFRLLGLQKEADILLYGINTKV